MPPPAARSTPLTGAVLEGYVARPRRRLAVTRRRQAVRSLGYEQRLSHLILCGQSRFRSLGRRQCPACLSGSRWLRLILATALATAADVHVTSGQ